VTAASITSVTVLVATRDRPDALARCLRSLRTAADVMTSTASADVEVLVVDNGPDRATRAVVEEIGGVRYLVEPRPGASRARNLGLQCAAGEVVAVTDDDVTVDPDWLMRLCAGFERAPDVAAVTGLVVPGSLDTEAQSLFESWGGFNKGYEPRLFDRHPPAGVGPLYPYTPGLYGSGNNVAFRTDVLRGLGGYDIALGPGTPACAAEELDLFFSLITSGHRIAYEPAAIVWHHHRATEAELAAQLHDYGIGLSALMTKWALKSPAHAFDLLRRIPAGALAMRHRAPVDGPPVVALPVHIRRAELRGLLAGPLGLLSSRRSAARQAAVARL
jgi:GT2 family glycosyltransferase